MVCLARTALFAFFAWTAAAVAGAQAQAPAEPAPTPMLVELFSSQGCPSCPPAEEFLSELAQRPDLLVLSLHVDYWDYLGWKDPFAQRAFAERQRAYAHTFPQRFIYTPQLIVDGRVQEVGSEREAVERLVDRTRAEPVKRLHMRREGKLVMIENPEGVAVPDGRHAAVWFVTFDPVRHTKVTRGENAGRTLDNVNVVRRLQRIATFTGEPITVTLDPSLVEHGQGCAVIVQAGNAGAVLGLLPVE